MLRRTRLIDVILSNHDKRTGIWCVINHIEKLDDYLHAATRDNTRRSYQSAVRYFETSSTHLDSRIARAG